MDRRRLLPLLVVLVVGASGVPASDAAPTQRVHRAWAFDGTGSAVLLLEGRVEGPGVLATVVGEAPGRGQPADVLVGPQVLDVTGQPAAAYGRLGTRDLCAAPVTTCRVDDDGALLFTTVHVVSASDATLSASRFHLYLEGRRVSVRDTLLGFRRTTVGGGRRVVEAAADGLGVRDGARTAAVHLSARASAGRRGSIAIAVPPCTTAGAGLVRLTGPGVGRTATCPTREVAAVTRRPGAWTLDGPSAGLTGDSTRLLVLDL